MPARAANSKNRVLVTKFQIALDGGSLALAAFQLTPPLGRSMTTEPAQAERSPNKSAAWLFSFRSPRKRFDSERQGKWVPDICEPGRWSGDGVAESMGGVLGRSGMGWAGSTQPEDVVQLSRDPLGK